MTFNPKFVTMPPNNPLQPTASQLQFLLSAELPRWA